jgi:hypothetical protein
MGIGNPHRLDIAHKQPAEIFLVFGGRAGRRRGIGLGVNHHVAQEAIQNGAE